MIEMKLFVVSKKYTDVYTNIKNIFIKKIENKSQLEINYCYGDKEIIPLSEIKICFMIDEKTLEEYFRYEK